MSDDWWDRANCLHMDPEIFFDKDTRAAQHTCAACTVITPCLNWALDHSIEEGVWGGHTAHERTLLLPARRYKAARLQRYQVALAAQRAQRKGDTP